MKVCIGVDSLTDLPRVYIRVDGNRPIQSNGQTQTVTRGCEVYIRQMETDLSSVMVKH